jgi:hypothetical protein
MKQSILLAVLLAASQSAHACSQIVFPPGYELAHRDVVVLARPLAASFRPKESANLRYTAEFRETVLWRVLKSWKGPWKTGDTFTTRRTFEASRCSYVIRLSDRAPKIVYGRGGEPYRDFVLVPGLPPSYHLAYLNGLPSK